MLSSFGAELMCVTAVDCSLLDNKTLSFSPTQPAFHRLQALEIPLILNSSKTAVEMLRIRKLLDNKHPFVVENGSAVILPEGNKFKELSLGMNRAEILSIIHNLREEYAFEFTGFADMGHEDLMGFTGLSMENAALAMQRQFTEPLLWQVSEQQFTEFADKLQSAGLSLIKGGRFWHVSGTADKGKALY